MVVYFFSIYEDLVRLCTSYTLMQHLEKCTATALLPRILYTWMRYKDLFVQCRGDAETTNMKHLI